MDNLNRFQASNQQQQIFNNTAQSDTLSANYYGVAPKHLSNFATENNNTQRSKNITASIQPAAGIKLLQQQQKQKQQLQLSPVSLILGKDQQNNLSEALPLQSLQHHVSAVPQKTQPTNRRIFEDSNQRAIRTSSVSFDNQANEQQQQQQQHQRIFQQSPFKQKNKKTMINDDYQAQAAAAATVSDNTRNASYQQEQETLKQMYEQQQLTQALPQFAVNSYPNSPTQNPTSLGIKLLKNSQISLAQQPDQQEYSKAQQPQLSQLVNSNHSDISSDLVTFGGAKLKQQQQQLANTLDASQFNEAATTTTKGAQQQHPEQLSMPIQYFSLPQQQNQQQPLKASNLQNAVNTINNTQTNPPKQYGLNSYNRVTEPTYPQQYPLTQNNNNNQLSQQQSPVRNSTPSSNLNGIITTDTIPATNKTIILSESDYQKILQDQKALTDELVNTQVLVKQLNQTIAEISKHNQEQSQIQAAIIARVDNNISRHNQLGKGQEDSLEIATLQNQLMEKDLQLNQVIQELRDAQKQLGQFADQVLSLKARLNEKQQRNDAVDQERIRQLQEQQLQYQSKQIQINLAPLPSAASAFSSQQQQSSYSQQNQQAYEQSISSSSPDLLFAPAKNLDQRKASGTGLAFAPAALTQGRSVDISNSNPSDMQVTTRKGMNQNRLTLCTKIPRNQLNS